MGHVDDGNVVHFQDGVVDLEARVNGGRSAGDDFRDAYRRIVADVRIVRAAGNAEAQAGIASLQRHFFVIPRVVAVGLKEEIDK